MDKYFAEMLVVGGKSNSLGKVNEVIELVLHDKSRLNELYDCLFDEDAWVRMRAADALEKNLPRASRLATAIYRQICR